MVCAPSNASKVLVIDTEKKSSYLLAQDYGTEPEKYLTCVTATEDKVVCAPFNAEKALIVDSKTNAERLVAIDYAGTLHKYRGCTAISEGLVACSPANANHVLVISTTMKTVQADGDTDHAGVDLNVFIA